MSWVFTLEELPASETLVLLALADAANDEGLAWPSQATLAPKARCSERSLRRHVQFLKDHGLIDVRVRSGQSGRKSNIYQLHVGAEFSLQNNQPAILAGCETPVDNFEAASCHEVVDNPSLPREITNRPKWPVAEGLGSQPDTGGRSQPDTSDLLVPYIDLEPSIEPPTIPSQASVDNFSGVDVPAPQVTDVDWNLIQSALPQAYVALLGRGGARSAAQILHAALAQGWTVGAIRRKLDANAIPDNVRNGSGLVLYRLREAVSCPPPPKPGDEKRKRIEGYRQSLQEIIDGTSVLPKRNQLLRANSIAGTFEGQSILGDLVDQAFSKLEGSK